MHVRIPAQPKLSIMSSRFRQYGLKQMRDTSRRRPSPRRTVERNSAAARTESRGAHDRSDHPDRDDANWMKHSLAWRTGDTSVQLDTRPVHTYTLSDEIEYIKPKARTY